MYIDGKRINNTVEATLLHEKLENELNPFEFAGKEVSVTLKNAEMKIHRMSDRTRQWCKEIRWNGKLYL